MAHFDILIRNGFVADGTGSPGRIADVAVNGEYITAVGDLKDDTADRVLDAQGHLVCPGFIDPHTHEETVALLMGISLST